MHPEAIEFCQSVKRQFPQMFHGKTVLDVGSYDVNGNNRHLFTDCAYTGIDVAAGPNVDKIGEVHQVLSGAEECDVVICTEMLEHDPNWVLSIRAMYRALKPGGLLIITCATTGRKEHGTSKSEPEANPGFKALGDYYQNLTIDDIDDALAEEKAEFTQSFVKINSDVCDLYFWGIK